MKVLSNQFLDINAPPPSWLVQLALRCLCLVPPWALHLFFPLLFSGGDSFPLLSSPKGFPSASDYLWLQLVSRQPSGPVWRLRSLSLLQTALREGWRGVGEENTEGSDLADTAVQSQETQVKEKGTHENVTPHLGSGLFL